MDMFRTLAIIIVFLLILWILFKIIKSLFKVVIIGIVIVIISMAAFGFLVYKDIKNIQENFDTKPKLCILEDNDDVLLAAAIGSINTTSPIQVMGGDDLKAVKAKVKAGKVEDLKGNYYKVFVFTFAFFEEGLSDKVDVSGPMPGLKELPKATILNIIEQDDPVDIVVDELVARDDTLNEMPSAEAKNVAREDLLKEMQTPEAVRAAFFFIALQDIMDKRGISYIFQQYRKKNLAVYPKTILFTVVQEAPGFIVNPLINRSSG